MSELEAIQKIKAQATAGEAEQKVIKGGSKALKTPAKKITTTKLEGKKRPTKIKTAVIKEEVVKEFEREQYIGEAEVDGAIVDLFADTISGKEFYFEAQHAGIMLRVYI